MDSLRRLSSGGGTSVSSLSSGSTSLSRLKEDMKKGPGVGSPPPTVGLSSSLSSILGGDKAEPPGSRLNFRSLSERNWGDSTSNYSWDADDQLSQRSGRSASNTSIRSSVSAPIRYSPGESSSQDRFGLGGGSSARSSIFDNDRQKESPLSSFLLSQATTAPSSNYASLSSLKTSDRPSIFPSLSPEGSSFRKTSAESNRDSSIFSSFSPKSNMRSTRVEDNLIGDSAKRGRDHDRPEGIRMDRELEAGKAHGGDTSGLHRENESHLYRANQLSAKVKRLMEEKGDSPTSPQEEEKSMALSGEPNQIEYLSAEERKMVGLAAEKPTAEQRSPKEEGSRMAELPSWWASASKQLVKEMEASMEKMLLPIKRDVQELKGDVKTLLAGQQGVQRLLSVQPRSTSVSFDENLSNKFEQLQGSLKVLCKAVQQEEKEVKESKDEQKGKEGKERRVGESPKSSFRQGPTIEPVASQIAPPKCETKELVIYRRAHSSFAFEQLGPSDFVAKAVNAADVSVPPPNEFLLLSDVFSVNGQFNGDFAYKVSILVKPESNASTSPWFILHRQSQTAQWSAIPADLQITENLKRCVAYILPYGEIVAARAVCIV